jgi:hypothetical protein
MSWSPSSKVLVGLLLVVAVAAGPAAALTVSNEDATDEAAVGEQITAEFTLEELYQNPQTDAWTLGARTGLQSATWTISYYDQQGNQINATDYGGNNVSAGGVDPADGVSEVRVQVTGTVPEIDAHSYPEKETFLVAELEQVREGGTLNSIDTWRAQHYTEDSRAAREAIAAAEDAIQEAKQAGATVEDEESTLQSAISVYRGDNPQEAQNLAEQAQSNAESALSDARQTQSRNQLLLYGGIGVVALLVIGGGAYLYLNSRESHDKLG